MRCAVGAAGGALPSTSSAYVPMACSPGTRRRGLPATPSVHRRHPFDVMMRGEGLGRTWSARGGHAIDMSRSCGSGIAPSPRQSHRAVSPGTVAASWGGDWGPLSQSEDDFPVDVPRSTDDLILIAERAVRRRLADGYTRQKVIVELPVTPRGNYDFTGTNPKNRIPTRLKDEFRAANVLAAGLLQKMSRKQRVAFRRLDDGMESDPVMLFTNEEMRAVVFPNAESLPQLRQLEKEPKPLLLINPQWQTKGNVVSDFGFGPWRQRAEDFLQRFPVSYGLEQNRIGNPTSVNVRVAKDSGVVWVIQSAPSDWQAYAIEPPQNSKKTPEEDLMAGARLLGSFKQRPEYSQLQDMLGGGSGEGKGGAAAEKVEAAPLWFPDREISIMDKRMLFAVLELYGAPTSGKVVQLRERVQALQLEARVKTLRTGGTTAAAAADFKSIQECRICAGQGRRPCKACAGFNRPNLSCSQCGGWGHLLCPGCGGGRYLEVVAEEAAAGTDAGTHSKGGSSSVVGVPPAAAAVAPMFGGSGSEGEQEAAMAAMEQTGLVGATAASEQSEDAQVDREQESASAPVVAALATSTSRSTAKAEEAGKGVAETKETSARLIRELSKAKSKAGSKSKAEGKTEGKAKAEAAEEENRMVNPEGDTGVSGTTKLRRCTFCGKQGHNRRTCPDLREKSD